MKLCATPSCTNKKASHSNSCNACLSRTYRAKYPARAAYYNLKHRAKERGKEVLFTRAEFEDWCEKTGYHMLKGKHADGMSVDRVKEDGPYSIDNIEMVPLGTNSKKFHYHNGHVTEYVPPVLEPTDPDRPF